MGHISTDSLSDGIYRQLKSAILDGRLRPGERLPASRILARDVGVSRNTVLNAWDRLTAEGYLIARQGSATRVRADLPIHGSNSLEESVPVPLAPWAEHLAKVPAEYPETPLTWDFRSTQPAVDELPLALWRRLQAALWLRITPQDLDYQDPCGRPELRKSLASHLALQRGVTCHPDQIIIVNGAQQALDLLARLLVGPGDVVALEQPAYTGASLALGATGARLVPVPVDRDGLQVDRMPDAWRLVYVTPSHQYPTGAVLPLQRRLALIEKAAATGGLILEDDYNSEFRYQGRSIPALQGLDRQGRVIYVGTFSKALFPALRIGYIVAPASLIDPLTRAKWLTDQHVSVEPQLLLARLIDDGHFDHHVRHMCRRYEAKAQRLAHGLAPIADILSVPEPVQGLHLFCPITGDLDPQHLVDEAAVLGVGLKWQIGPQGPGLVMGFARLSEGQIDEGTRRIVALVDQMIGSAR